MRHTLKASVALVAVIALMTIIASPTAAQTATLTGGTLTINLTPSLTWPLVSTTDACADTLDVDFPDSLTSGHATITFILPFIYNAIWYILSISHSSFHVNSSHVTTGTNTSKHAMTIGSSTGTGVFVEDIMIYTSSGAGSCTPLTAKCSDVDASFPVITGLYTGAITHSTTSQHTLTTSGTLDLNTFIAPLVAAGCTPPFSAWNGKTFTFAGLTAHID